MNGAANDTLWARTARQTVLEQIKEASIKYGRGVADVQLLAVSKTFPAERIMAMIDAGQRAFGENYLQESLEKQQIIRAKRPDVRLEWHFIGPIQSNKTRPLAEHYDWVHTIERLKIATRLNDQRPQDSKPLNVCLQVNIDAETTKSGCPAEQALDLALQIAQLPRLCLRGIMAIPAQTDDPQAQRNAFAKVAQLFANIKLAMRETQAPGFEGFDTLSMGMSADLDSAISQGSTMVRVGTALFGARTTRPTAK